SHRDELVITPATETTESDIVATWHKGDTLTQHNIALSYHPAEEYQIARDSNIACFDLDKVKFPLTLRHWRQGDTFVPFGMRGRKKVSDYFNDHKYSLIEKEQALLLCDSEKILWIVGQRPCNDARITKHTTQIIELKLLK
ncbi:MAG: tRNA lysidine(34) synthetase TilS, partial [Bacteroidaceae bacterium]|nr:tRNA lysidine(34) synthetase TilS [Bacteroidaceae bacterium]